MTDNHTRVAPADPIRVGAEDGPAVLERLHTLPGARELLATAEQHDGAVELVGGAVRDIMLGRSPRELDVVVESDSHAFAHTLARRLGTPAGSDSEDRGEVTYHERFNTALVRWHAGEIDVAMRRAETYPAPGALPVVARGTPEQDLQRRDFSVNAIAVALSGERRGQLRFVDGALDDLAQRRLRVLHDSSFLDDPTRILRLARYAARLSFEVDPHTAALAASALGGNALESVSGERLGAELRLAFAEPDPIAALAEIDRLGVFAAWEPGVSFDEHVVRTALEMLPDDGSISVLLGSALLFELARNLLDEEAEPSMRGFLNDLQLPSGVGDRVFGAAVSAVFVSEHVDDATTAADLLELTSGTQIESLALAAAVRELEDGPGSYGRRVVEDWLGNRRHVALELTGDDLIAAGVPEGPEIGVRLEESYKLLVEERIEPGRDSELRAALEVRI
jgi:tRNA nucleotidyltransferase (CCA-adding enzyme)